MVSVYLIFRVFLCNANSPIIKKLVGHTSDNTDVTNERYNKNKATITQLVSAIEKVIYKGKL